LNFFIGLSLYIIGQILIWVQNHGQFIWPWFHRHPLLLAFTIGGLVSYIFINGTYYMYQYFDQTIWPIKFVGFSTGMIVFALLTYFLHNEPMSLKTIVSLILATLLILIQIFW
jgi:hypothetical protein